MIAMAIANSPRLLVADEPTTALDVTIQAQILDVFRQARDEAGAATVLTTHDLGVVAETADRVVVRCWKAPEQCARQVPALVVREGSDHPSACLYPEVLTVTPGTDRREGHRAGVPEPRRR